MIADIYNVGDKGYKAPNLFCTSSDYYVCDSSYCHHIYLSRKGDTALEGVQVIKSLDELDF